MKMPSHIKIKHSPRARRVALRLDPVERVFTLVVPKGMSERKALAFAEGQESWMQEKLAALPPQIAFEHGAVISVLGRRTEICVYHEPDMRVTKIALEGDVLHVRTNRNDPSARIVRFLKSFIKDELEILTREKAARIGKDIQSISVRDTKTRWGSCSADGNLSFSWRLVFAPYEAFDYVVAHEVAHLEHLNHSRAFWDLCADLSENYEEGKYWMKAHGSELMRYG